MSTRSLSMRFVIGLNFCNIAFFDFTANKFLMIVTKIRY